MEDHPTIGILSLIVGISIFSVQDVIIKLLSGGYPVYEAITIRSLVALPILWVLVARKRRDFWIPSDHAPLLLFRGAVMFASYMTYYLALAALPLATCVALFFTAPLLITLLSALILHERVNLGRWIAILVGFAGVILVVRPGSDVFDAAALLPVFAALTYGLAQILARKLGEHTRASVMTFYANGVYITGGIALAMVFGGEGPATDLHPSVAFLVRGWVNPDLRDFLLMALCGVIAAAGLTLLSHAYRSAPASIVAPFEYTAIILGVAYGWFIWGELPDTISWLGFAIIICAGIYVVTGRKKLLRD